MSQFSEAMDHIGLLKSFFHLYGWKGNLQGLFESSRTVTYIHVTQEKNNSASYS